MIKLCNWVSGVEICKLTQSLFQIINYFLFDSSLQSVANGKWQATNFATY